MGKRGKTTPSVADKVRLNVRQGMGGLVVPERLAGDAVARALFDQRYPGSPDHAGCGDEGVVWHGRASLVLGGLVVLAGPERVFRRRSLRAEGVCMTRDNPSKLVYWAKERRI